MNCWVKCRADNKFHYVEGVVAHCKDRFGSPSYVLSLGQLSLCGDALLETFPFEILTNVEHHDKCKDCYWLYHEQRDKRQKESQL